MAQARMLSYTQDSTWRPVPSLTVIQRAHALQIKVKSEALWQRIVCVQGNSSCQQWFDALEQHLNTSVLTTSVLTTSVLTTSVLTTSVPVLLSCCTLLLTCLKHLLQDLL